MSFWPEVSQFSLFQVQGKPNGMLEMAVAQCNLTKNNSDEFLITFSKMRKDVTIMPRAWDKGPRQESPRWKGGGGGCT